MRAKPFPASRISGLIVVALSAVCLLAGCTRSSEATKSTGKEVVIFMDFSQSIRGDNRALFEEDLLKSVVPSLSAGDRLVIAPINDRTLTGFHPLLEVTFPEQPVFDGWTDNRLKHIEEVKNVDEEVKRLREGIEKKIPEIMNIRSRSQKTDVFSSILMAGKLFDHAPRQKVLVLMSDMIQDYPPYRFEKITWTPEKNQEILSDLLAKGMIPNLSEVCVYISGASAATAEQAGDIARFWQQYFKRANANLDSSRYAHVLLHWPPNTSCPSQGRDLPPAQRGLKEQAAAERAGAQNAGLFALLAP